MAPTHLQSLTCPREIVAHHKAAGHGVRIALRIAETADLARPLRLSPSEPTHLRIPGLGLELERAPGFSFAATGGDGAHGAPAETSVLEVLRGMVAELAPTLGAIGAGRELLAQLTHWADPDALPADPWVLIVEDQSGDLDLPGCGCGQCAGAQKQPLAPATSSVGTVAGAHTEAGPRFGPAAVQVFPTPSFKSRMPFRLCVCRLTAREDSLGGLRGGAVPELRLLEQPGLGIGSLTFYGSVVLARHLRECFPPDHWAGKRVLELGGGAGLLGVLLASVGARVTVTDRPEYLELQEINARLNAATLAASGGSLTPAVLRWGSAADHAAIDALGPFDAVVAAEVVYPHETGSAEAHRALLETLRRTVTPDTPAILLHSDRRTASERRFFTEEAPKHFATARVERSGGCDGLGTYFADSADSSGAEVSPEVGLSCGCGLDIAGFFEMRRAECELTPVFVESRASEAVLEGEWPSNGPCCSDHGDADGAGAGEGGSGCGSIDGASTHTDRVVAQASQVFEGRTVGEGDSGWAIDELTFSNLPCAVWTFTPPDRSDPRLGTPSAQLPEAKVAQ